MAAAETILDLLQIYLKKFIRVREAAATFRLISLFPFQLQLLV